MSRIWGRSIEGLTSVPISWSEEKVAHRTWACAAKADEPIVALLLGSGHGRIDWAKTPISLSEGLTFALFLTPSDPQYSGRHFMPEMGGSGLSFFCRDLAEPLTTYLPTATRSGSTICLAALNGPDRLEAGVLLLAKRDVKFGRNRIWHLRRDLESHVPGPLRRVLSYGRNGSSPAEEWE